MDSNEKEMTPLGENEIKKSDENFDNEKIYVSLKNINKVYDKNVHAVVDFNLDIKQKEFVVFVGPSGCGKSTTLRMIAGLEEISGGELYIDGVYSNDLSPKDRDIAMVFQSYSLYPNMSVYDNLAFSLKVKHMDKAEIERRVQEAAKILEIDQLLDRKPAQLSGGQRQRVALGRAIVRNAKIFLMDEPLSNLDAKLRVQMRGEIIKLHKTINATTIYVTHDQTEAMTMADRIVVMKGGYVQQIGTPLEIYRHPANQFVASFIGSPAMNFIDATYDKGKLIFADGTTKSLNKNIIKIHDEYYKNEEKRVEEILPKFKEFLIKSYQEDKKKKGLNVEEDEDYIKLEKHLELLKQINEGCPHNTRFGIRPEDITRVEKQTKDSFKAKVLLSELLGEQYYVHFNYGGKEIISNVFSENVIKCDEEINFVIKEDKIHLFDQLTGKTII